MDKNSEIIRIEIIRVLNENGKTRGTDLAKRVIQKVGNEKTVYREISALVESGEIEKRVHSRSHIEYELINLSESVSNQLKNLHEEIKIIQNEIKNFEEMSTDEKLSYFERLRATIHLINVVQSTESIMRLLSFYPAFKKDKMFSQVNRKIEDCWQDVMSVIAHQPEEDFLNEILTNLRLSQASSKNIN